MPRLPSILSTSTRLKMSPQRSSSPTRMPAARAARASASRSGSPPGSVANRSMLAKRANASATVSRSGSANASAVRPRNVKVLRPRGFRRQRQDRGAVGHQGLIRLAGAVPFEQGEFRMVQRAALAVAEHLGEFDDAALAGRQQFLAGEFRRRAQIKLRRRAVRGRERRGEGVQMGLVSAAKPATRRCRPRRNHARQTRRARPPRCGCAPAGTAGGRHGRAGPKRARRRARLSAAIALWR